MKFTTIAAALLIAGVTTTATAQQETDSLVDAEAAPALNIDTPIATLLADESAKAVVLKHLPGLDEHPAYEQFKTLSLVALKPWSQGQITDEIIESIKAELAALA